MGTQQRSSRSPPDHPSAYGTNSLPPPGPFNNSRYQTSPGAERKSLDQGPDPTLNGADGLGAALSTVLLRRLPPRMSNDALNSMFLFAEDFQDSRFVEYPDEQGLASAIARFRTVDGAIDAREKLNGKFNASSDAVMIVDMIQPSNLSFHGKPPSSEGATISRQISNAASSRGSPVSGRQTSRYFQSMGEKVAPGAIPLTNGDDLGQQPSGFFSVRSPKGPSFPDGGLRDGLRDGLRVTGKSMIGEDDADTGELLKDPVAYAKSSQPAPLRRNNSSTRPTTLRLANLSLNTAAMPDGAAGIVSPTSAGFLHSRQGPGSPSSEIPPSMVNGIGPMSPSSATTSAFPMSPTGAQQRHHYPPANPADQNPPCNTLYVGNLPVDTSEDELKAVFSKQRGYKRLCFRTKHNGPMCFVEFEDVSFATKALNELYGHPLHNSVKGGIRLSFSKNPLGVRAGQNNAMGLTSPIGPGGMSLGGIGGPPFSTASGPPPGLSMPPGLTSPGLSSNLGGGGSFFSPSSPPSAAPGSHRGATGAFMSNGLGAANASFKDGMMGR